MYWFFEKFKTDLETCQRKKTLTFSFLQIHVLFHLMGSSHICHQICTQLNGFETNYACLHDAISKWGGTCMR